MAEPVPVDAAAELVDAEAPVPCVTRQTYRLPALARTAAPGQFVQIESVYVKGIPESMFNGQIPDMFDKSLVQR